MKLTKLIAEYQALYQSLCNSPIENDPLGFEADQVLKSICKLQPQDSTDVAALAALAKHIIQVEEDPSGAVPLLHNIVHWAERSGTAIPTNIVPFLRSTDHH
ncbi:MAG: hypothetical protein EYC62_06160 [Alphaproteobacteria bacterium]|nr:MAG: hypothetical protein EYC62_06160 [Alphaproteobacteria bacterium]